MYLQSNIYNIPQSRHRANFSQLYQELVEDSEHNLKDIQNDESLNLLYSRIKISEKLIEIEENNMKKLQKTKNKFKILNFITQFPIKICMKISQSNQIKIEIISITLHTYSIILCLNFNIKIFVLDDYLLSI